MVIMQYEVDRKLMWAALIALAIFLAYSLLIEPFPYSRTVSSIVLLLFGFYLLMPVYSSFTVEGKGFNEKYHGILLAILMVLFFGLAFRDLWLKGVNYNYLFSGIVIAIIGIHVARSSEAVLSKSLEKDAIAKKGYFGMSRHPMYLSVLLFLFGIALATRSVLAIAVSAVIAAVLYFFAKKEELYLNEFEGYREYAEKTGVIPFAGKRKASGKKQKIGEITLTKAKPEAGAKR